MRTLVAIPVYNEQRYVEGVLGEVRKYADNILVIDDGSTDETPLKLIRQPVEMIRHAENRGYGRTLVDAFRWAACYRYDWLITMDCDMQHEPASLPVFHAAIEMNQADVISGSRYMTPSEDQDQPPADRRAINTTITKLVNDRLDLNITDAFCGFKAYRVKALSKLAFDEPGYAFPLQFWVQAAANDLRVTEVPIRLIYNDPNRSFGGPLDNANHRLTHYKQVFATETAKFPERFAARCSCHSHITPATSPSTTESCGDDALHASSVVAN